MKASRLIFTLLLASSVAVVQLAAQQTKADQKPIGEVKAKAEAGDADSQVELGLRYEQGKGVGKDQVEAVKWYRKAAEQNYTKAQYNLGICYNMAKAWRRIGSRLTGGSCWRPGKAMRMPRRT
jgi:TPR repeat protein